MTPSGHGPVVSSPPTGSGDSDCFKFPRHAHGQAHRGPWQGLLSPPRLAGRDGRALTLQGTVIIARGPESALRGPQGSPSPSLCFTGSMNSRLPPPPKFVGQTQDSMAQEWGGLGFEGPRLWNSNELMVLEPRRP